MPVVNCAPLALDEEFMHEGVKISGCDSVAPGQSCCVMCTATGTTETFWCPPNNRDPKRQPGTNVQGDKSFDCPCYTSSDTDKDGRVNVQDLLQVLGMFGVDCTTCPCSLDGVADSDGAPTSDGPPGCGNPMLRGKSSCDDDCSGLAFVSAMGVCTGCMSDGTTPLT